MPPGHSRVRNATLFRDVQDRRGHTCHAIFPSSARTCRCSLYLMDPSCLSERYDLFNDIIILLIGSDVGFDERPYYSVKGKKNIGSNGAQNNMSTKLISHHPPLHSLDDATHHLSESLLHPRKHLRALRASSSPVTILETN
ncbi:hypothetical protein VTN77DRAFT_3011 [Rasamsonia byssochlamydoides]|uniref:uncharacterized protein n=1 Tax=Rasamsonia byssochlamydoides TaxID=89139 RepID=UPI0037436703